MNTASFSQTCRSLYACLIALTVVYGNDDDDYVKDYDKENNDEVGSLWITIMKMGKNKDDTILKWWFWQANFSIESSCFRNEFS